MFLLSCILIICISFFIGILEGATIQDGKIYNYLIENEGRITDTFCGTIIEIGKNIKGQPLIAVEAIQLDPDYGGRYILSVKETTSIIWKGKEIDVSELEPGDKVKITFSDESMQVSEPVTLYHIVSIVLIDEKK